MFINFRSPEAWQNLNDHVAQLVGADQSRIEARVYQGVAAAAIESVVGLAKTFSHKKKVFYVKDCDYFSDSILLPLAKDGYDLQALDRSVFKSPQEWADTVGKETLLVLYSVDDPILGELYDVKNFESVLAGKSVIKVRLSHSRHFYEKFELREDRNSIAIYSLSASQALAIHGERTRVGVMLANELSYPPLAALEWLQHPKPSDEEKVIRFEMKNIAGAKPFWSPNPERIYDRAVIFWTDMDGSALIDRLSRELGFDLGSPGVESRLETTSLSRLKNGKVLNYLRARGIAPEVLRGLVMIDSEMLDENLENKIIGLRQEIIADQFGE